MRLLGFTADLVCKISELHFISYAESEPKFCPRILAVKWLKFKEPGFEAAVYDLTVKILLLQK